MLLTSILKKFFVPVTHCRRNHLSLVGCLYGYRFRILTEQQPGTTVLYNLIFRYSSAPPERTRLRWWLEIIKMNTNKRALPFPQDLS